jgi:branched-chain amino acid aminotransferase
MSCVIRRIAAVGEPVIDPVAVAADSLREAASAERPGGVYAAFGTWHDHRVIRLTDHFERFRDSARRVGFELRVDRDLVCSELCSMLRTAGYPGARIRISVHPDDLAAGARAPLVAAIEPYAGLPPHVQNDGVSCLSAPHRARANPRAKQTSWLAGRASLPGDPYEWLLLDNDQRILEGASSNFYAVIDGVLATAGSGVLFGISRSIVLEVATGLLPVHLDAPRYDDVPRMSECFITSASRGIVPVVEIDERTIGSGRPGEVTRRLISRYEDRAAELEEPLCSNGDGFTGN